MARTSWHDVGLIRRSCDDIRQQIQLLQKLKYVTTRKVHIIHLQNTSNDTASAAGVHGCTWLNHGGSLDDVEHCTQAALKAMGVNCRICGRHHVQVGAHVAVLGKQGTVVMTGIVWSCGTCNTNKNSKDYTMECLQPGTLITPLSLHENWHADLKRMTGSDDPNEVYQHLEEQIRDPGSALWLPNNPNVQYQFDAVGKMLRQQRQAKSSAQLMAKLSRYYETERMDELQQTVYQLADAGYKGFRGGFSRGHGQAVVAAAAFGSPVCSPDVSLTSLDQNQVGDEMHQGLAAPWQKHA